MLKNNKGFTLVEVFIVIMILAILLAIAAPVFIATIHSNKTAQTIEVINQNKEPKIDVEENAPVVNKNSSKGEDNKL